jgi:hypothetical protein
MVFRRKFKHLERHHRYVLIMARDFVHCNRQSRKDVSCHGLVLLNHKRMDHYSLHGCKFIMHLDRRSLFESSPRVHIVRWNLPSDIMHRCSRLPQGPQRQSADWAPPAAVELHYRVVPSVSSAASSPSYPLFRILFESSPRVVRWNLPSD